MTFFIIAPPWNTLSDEMDKKNRKLSPLEFLNQLKAGGKSAKHLPQGQSPPSELNLDFSDLAAPAESASAAGAVAAAPSASATAVAEPPPACCGCRSVSS